MKKQLLNKYDNSPHSVGAGRIKQILWLVLSAIFFKNSLSVLGKIKILILRSMGAEVGNGVVIKQRVHIKYPWKLKIGDHCWIGEDVWLDNVEDIIIDKNVCISQGALLLTGSHDHKKEAFDYLCGAIYLEEGVWIGAKAIVAKNVRCKSHSILSINSVAEKDLEPYVIYKGNPCRPVMKRKIQE